MTDHPIEATPKSRAQPAIWLCRAAPFLLAALSVAAVLTPLLLVNPARNQDAFDIRLGYLLGTWNPTLTLAFLLVASVASWFAWRRTRWWVARGALIVSLFVLAGTTMAARQNMYERMFEPLARPGFVAISDAQHLSDRDMVLGVSLGGESAAYPVGIVAYHHIVNDRLGTEPYVVTY